jgi:hypothetical protein
MGVVWRVLPVGIADSLPLSRSAFKLLDNGPPWHVTAPE